MNLGLKVKTSFGEKLQKNPDTSFQKVGERLATTVVTGKAELGKESTLQAEFADSIRALFMPFIDDANLKPEIKRNPEQVKSKLESLKSIVPPVIDELLTSLDLAA